MNLKASFGTNVRNQRKARGLTQEVLAELVDVSITTIGKIERGEAAPSFETAENIASALDVNVLALFGAGKQATPPGKRGQLLRKIETRLADMNDEQLARAARMLDAFAGR